jgi:hypothetical protein
MDKPSLIFIEQPNMTIGDIETLLDFKDIDPILVTQLMKDMRDLAKALVYLLLYLPNRNKSFF